MENIRGEISALRSQTLAARSQSMPRGLNATLASTELPALTNPTRVKKLTKFFGDEPPLLRLFLKKLGYEVREIIINFNILYILLTTFNNSANKCVFRNMLAHLSKNEWGWLNYLI